MATDTQEAQAGGTKFDATEHYWADKQQKLRPSSSAYYKAKYFRSAREIVLSTVIFASILATLYASIYSFGKIVYPDVIQKLLDDGLGKPLLATFLALMIAYVAALARSSAGESFASIDQRAQSRLYEFRIERLQQALQESLKQAESKPKSSTPSEPPTSPQISKNTFAGYVEDLIASLDRHIAVSEEKASTLLDKGTLYLRRGIYFYVATIVVWQALALFHGGFEAYMVVGVLSCSLTFLVVEFLAAWFLKQYRGFVDSASQLVRIKSVFNKIMLSYYAVEEFPGDDGCSHADMRGQLMAMLGQDLAWTEAKDGKDMNHMVEMFQSVSGVIEKLKDVMPRRGAGE